MKTLTSRLLCALGLFVAVPVFAADPPPITIADVPRHTQAGPPPASGKGIPAPFPANAKLPTLWLIGDSTVRNGTAGDGGNGQWGWGAPLVAYFDAAKINVVNRAAGGTSARSFYGANWKDLVALIKKGDFVLMQFGTNDGGNPATSVGDLRGVGDEAQDITNRAGQPETVHAYGWYLRQIIRETRARGAVPIVCSLIPRKTWEPDGHMQRASASFAGWAAQIAKAENAGFIDLNELIAARYDALGHDAVMKLFPQVTPDEHTHTNLRGADLNAQIVIAGLKSLNPASLQACFSAKAAEIPSAR